jgi:heme A synthase
MKPKPIEARRALLVSLILLVVQVGLGDVVINSNLNAVVTALHLANATLLYSFMVVAGVYMYLYDKKGYRSSPPPPAQ